jgi:hypothetical protein
MVALLVLLMLAIIATTVARSNRLQLRMAGNDEARIAALQQALAIVDSILSNPVNMRLAGGVGYRACTPETTAVVCNDYTLPLAPDAKPAVGSLNVSITRLAPLQGPMPALAEAQASSAVHYRVAKYEVQVEYDATARQLGRAVLAQGVLVREPNANASGGGTP